MSCLRFSLAFVATCLLSFSVAAADPRVVGMEFTKTTSRNIIQRRDDSVSLLLENDRTLYTVELDIGTPPQHFRLQIDTGSSDLFVPSIDEDFCQENLQECIQTGAYTSNKSSTSISLGTPFDTHFGDGSTYNGTFYKDTVRFSGVTLDDVQFGVTVNTNDIVIGSQGLDAAGLLGVGFESNEATSPGFTYPNIISELYNNGLIGARSFSLYINARDAPSGSILFGGTDRSLYVEPLISAPMVARSEGSDITEYAVEWTSFTATSPSGTINLLPSDSDPIYTVLDSGTTSSFVPPSVIPSLYAYLGAVPLQKGFGLVPYNLSTTSADLTFGFGGHNGPKITVPLSEFIDPHSDNPTLSFDDGTPGCLLTLRENNENLAILGDNFLHSAYLVFDLDTKVISIAEANLTPSGPSSTAEIGQGSTGIPGVSTAVSEIPLSTTLPASTVGSAETAQQTTDFGNLSQLTVAPSRGSITAVGTVASATRGGNASYTGTSISPSIPAFSGAAVGRGKADMGMMLLGFGAIGLAIEM